MVEEVDNIKSVELSPQQQATIDAHDDMLLASVSKMEEEASHLQPKPPLGKMIMPDNRTRSGKRVINILREPRNSCGSLVTFPIKGSIVEREKPIRLRYQIWTDTGRAQVFDEDPDDIHIDGVLPQGGGLPKVSK